MTRLVLLLSIAASGLGAQVRPRLPYRDPRLPIEHRVRDLLSRMTPEEKFWQVFMAPWDSTDSPELLRHGVFGLQVRLADSAADVVRRHVDRINAIQRRLVDSTRLGIPGLMFEEALHGLVAPQATVFPQAIGLAASWDTALVERVASAIARETRSRGIRDVLSPVVNIASDVRWGRTEETYGEDPWLSARMATAFVRAFERAGIVATPKHFVANVGDGGRDSYPVDLSNRLLQEQHFPPFRAAIQEGGARSLMTSYNAVAGLPATQNPWLLRSVVKRDWGFRGFIISDMSATSGPVVLHLTEASTASAVRRAFRAGLDVVFQGSLRDAPPYRQALLRGGVPVSLLDDAVRRVLHVKFALGLFEQPYASSDSAEIWNDHASHRALAREAAVRSVVLLRNRGVLPLSRPARVVVIGTDAAEARLGGYSGTNRRVTSIVDGIRARAGDRALVSHVAGPGRSTQATVTIPREAVTAQGARGWKGEYFAHHSMTGTPQFVRQDEAIDFFWTLGGPGPGLPADWYAARWSGRVTAPADGVHHIGVEANDGVRLYVDDTLRIDHWDKVSAGVIVSPVSWAPGSAHEMRVEFRETRGNGRIRLLWDAGIDPSRAEREIAQAVETARASDVAIVVVGIEEGEFRDRSSLALPGHQEALIRRVAASGTPTVVSIVGGSAVTMSRWIDSVGAVVHVWYPGEEGGHAVADVLFGDANPGGRLPITFPLSEGQLPMVYNHHPTGRGDWYSDLSGEPLFPFGFGLSYTSFSYTDLAVLPMDARGTVTVRCTVRNTGARTGDEVVQVYVRDLVASVTRPVLQLAGFTRVTLTPGESREVLLRIERRQLEMMDAAGRWVMEPGVFQVLVGASARDIQLRGEFHVPTGRGRSSGTP